MIIGLKGNRWESQPEKKNGNRKPAFFVVFLHGMLCFHMKEFMSMGDKCIQDSQFSFSLERGKKERINSPLMGS